GTNTICNKDGTVDVKYIDDVARQIVELEKMNVQSIIVTSGAIGSGSSELGLNGRQKDISEKQACAAVGQTAVMLAYREAFGKYNKCVGQILLTYDAFSDRKRYLNLKKTIDELFALKAVPIVNENDVISTDEIEEVFGDNDKLSALVASKIDAELLLMLTDVDGLYDRNPDTDPHAKLISTVDEITKDIDRIAGIRKNERSVGGMKTKLGAAKMSMESGCYMIIANGRTENVIIRAVKGEDVGTLFTPKRKYTNKERWVLFASPKGKILVDAGAAKALRDGKSLLPWGIEGIDGRFKEGDVVRIGDFAKGISNFSSNEIADLKEKCHSERKAGIQKTGNDKVVVSNENIVMLD
ncbi:MAG: glutamate 5-kinase, partial [Thermoplasmata archaeon]|nr:glutamate 5-kinase [Thermoplasmata archaeon]